MINNKLELEGFITDISKRKIAEENLRKSEERFRSITEQTTDVVFITDDKGIITYLSPAAKDIFGYDISEMTGKHFTEMITKDEIEQAMSKFKYAMDSSLPVKNLEVKMVGKNVPLIYGEVNGSIFSTGDFIGTAGIIRDISERKKAEEELIKAKEKAEEMNRIKTSFLANMSHEVRTPLVAILGFSEVLGEIVKDEEIRNYVEMIHKGGERLLDTLNLILDLSVIEAQKMKIELIPLDIVKEVTEVVKLFEKTAEKKNLRIETLCKSDSIILNLDAKILRQIMNNLVNNAVKYTNAGSIKVEIDEEEKDNNKYIAIRIEDTGIGIPVDKRNLIWDEFRQASEGFNRSFEGAGLGLSITKKFVEKLGGTIFLEKSEIGVGSVFTVFFPFEESMNIKGELKQGDFQKKSNSELKEKIRMTILYIEDDPIAINIVEAFLKEYYNIDSVLSGSEGIVKAKNKLYDAILMDINLGKDMNGIETTQEIRNLSGYKDIPIIAVTAFAMVGDKDEFFAKGCTHYISKPFTKQDLQKILAEALLLKPKK
jgi:PAS domain S-box-containing protein